MVANTAGQTKKSAICPSTRRARLLATALAGHPRLGTSPASKSNADGSFCNANDAPCYVSGVRGCLDFFAAQLALVIVNFRTLVVLNRVRRSQRVANGKPGYIQDTSMSAQYQGYGKGD
jgi:hypothetical protein